MCPLVGEEQVTAQRVQALALVELAANSSPEFVVGDIAAYVERAAKPHVFLRCSGERILPAAGVQFGDEQACGGMSEFHRPDQPEEVVPVIGDQLGLDRLAQEWPGLRVTSRIASRFHTF